VPADPHGLDPEIRHAHFVRSKHNRPFRRIQQLETIPGVDRQPDRLPLEQIIVDRNRHGHLVAARQRGRQIEIHEELLENPQRAGGAAEPSVGARCHPGHPPVRDRIGHLEVHDGGAVGPGDDQRIGIERLRKVLPQVGLSLTAAGGGTDGGRSPVADAIFEPTETLGK